jgi:hypothetical protein
MDFRKGFPKVWLKRQGMGGRKTVPKRVHTWLLALFGFGMLVCCSIAPIRMPREQSDLEKACELFHLALEENERLRWDKCLTIKASEMAKRVYEMGDFSDDRIRETPGTLSAPVIIVEMLPRTWPEERNLQKRSIKHGRKVILLGKTSQTSGSAS